MIIKIINHCELIELGKDLNKAQQKRVVLWTLRPITQERSQVVLRSHPETPSPVQLSAFLACSAKANELGGM